MTIRGTLSLQTVEGTGLRFGARFASGFTTEFDSGASAAAPNPVEALLGALAACEGMDVISILRKQRIEVTAYEIEMEGERAETPPRRFLSMTLVHRVTGHGVPADAVAEAVRLSEEKYCSVHHTLDPAMPITSRVEVLEG
jgi:putative redox protein